MPKQSQSQNQQGGDALPNSSLFSQSLSPISVGGRKSLNKRIKRNGKGRKSKQMKGRKIKRSDKTRKRKYGGVKSLDFAKNVFLQNLKHICEKDRDPNFYNNVVEKFASSFYDNNADNHRDRVEYYVRTIQKLVDLRFSNKSKFTLGEQNAKSRVYLRKLPESISKKFHNDGIRSPHIIRLKAEPKPVEDDIFNISSDEEDFYNVSSESSDLSATDDSDNSKFNGGQRENARLKKRKSKRNYKRGAKPVFSFPSKFV